MSWLNLNQSLSSLKGQITHFASEVLSDPPNQESGEVSPENNGEEHGLQEKCNNLELQVAALKKLNDDLQSELQVERVSKRNGVRDQQQSAWYWDPPSEGVHSNFQDNFVTGEFINQAQDSPRDRLVTDEFISRVQDSPSDRSNLKVRSSDDPQHDREELLRLKEENKNLTASIEELDIQHQMALEKLLNLKKELQKNSEILKQEHEDLKNTNDEYSAEIKELQAKLGDKDKEIERYSSLKSDFDTLHHKYQNLERVHGLLKETTEKFQEENQELHEENFKLQEQVTKLEHEIEMSAKHSELSDMVPRENYEQLLKELTDLRENRVSTNRMVVDDSNIDDNAKGVIESLRKEINELNHKLSLKEEHHETSDMKYLKSDVILRLYDQYVNFELPVDYVWNVPTSGDNTVTYKLEGAFKTLHEFKKDIDALEHAVTEKGLNEKRLQTQIDELTSENDLLNIDIQNYYAELSETKKNNDFLLSEITALKNTSKLEPIIETHEDNIVKLESELADSNQMNQSFQSEIKSIEKELGDVRSEKISLESTLKDLKEKYNTLSQEVDFYKQQTKEIEVLQKDVHLEEIEKTKLEVDRNKIEIDDLKKRVASSGVKNEQLAIDIQIIENDKVLLMKQLDDVKNELENKNDECRKLLSKQTSCEDKYKDYENNTISLKQQIEDLKSQLTERVVSRSTHEETTLKNNDNEEDNTYKPESLYNEIEHFDLLKRKAKAQEKLIGNASLMDQKDLKRINCDNLLASASDSTKEVEALRKNKEELIDELTTQQNKYTQNLTELQQTVDELKSKLTQQDLLQHQIKDLSSQNIELTNISKKLKDDLSESHTKVHNLNNDIKELHSDVKKKDSEIEKLYAVIESGSTDLKNLKQEVVKLEEGLTLRDSELERANKTLHDMLQKFNHSREHANSALVVENKTVDDQLTELYNVLSDKEYVLSQTKTKLPEMEGVLHELKAQLANKDEVINELNQSIIEMSEKMRTSENITQHNNTREIQEKEMTEQLLLRNQELTDLRAKLENLEKECTEHRSLIEKTIAEKSELINLITLKHNESIQYHAEIQRLNQILVEQSTEFKRVMEEKDHILQNSTGVGKNCSNCETLLSAIRDKDANNASLNKTISEYENIKLELLQAKDTVENLTQKCDNLDKSLAIQLETVKSLTAENAQLSEREQSAARELERLRDHLVHTEEHYTRELTAAERELGESRAQLRRVEDRAKQTSTVYTSNSIRSNQELETLRNQIKLLEKQRDEVQARVGELEDSKNRSEAALTNLQVVLEQFQRDKDRDVQTATEKLRNKMAAMKLANDELKTEIERLNTKLNQSLEGLQAATRLGDQLQTKTAQINDLKEQVRALQTSVLAAEERYYNAVSNQQDKVDKNLVKNYILNYVQASSHDNRNQVLRVLGTVLDFNQGECERVGLSRPAAATGVPAASLATEFVRFLEKESRPAATLPPLLPPPVAGAPHSTEVPAKYRPSSLSPNQTNLLFQNIENAETSSQISIETGSSTSENRPMSMTSPVLDSGVNQTRNNEGAILKQVLKDM